jgi:hypothetical protein
MTRRIRRNLFLFREEIAMRFALWALLSMLAVPALAGASGRVVGPDGAAIQSAQVCEFVEGSTENCINVDAAGFYRIEKPTRATLLVRAPGFVAKTVDAAPLAGPVELQRAAILEVSVIDAATKKPVPSGKIMLDSPSGRRIGSFVPFNKHGVRVSTLDPGDLFVRVEAEGYDPSGPVPVTLISGSKKSITVPLAKAGGTQR